MQFFRKCALLLAFVFSMNLQAGSNDACCEPCDDFFCDPCCGEWYAHVDWLIWKPRRCGLDYAWPRDGGANPEYQLGKGGGHCIEPGFDNGFRLGLFKDCNTSSYGVRWTHFRGDESSSANPPSGGDLQASRGHPEITRNELGEIQAPGDAKSKYDVDLDMIQLEGEYLHHCDGCSSVLVFGGVEMSYLDQTMDTEYDLVGLGAEVDGRVVKEKLEMDGYGLYVGLEAHRTFCRNLGFFGRVSFGTLLGKFDRSLDDRYYDYDEQEEETDFEAAVHTSDSCCSIFTHQEIVVGLDYDVCDFCGMDWSFQLGYEFQLWQNTPDFLNFTDHDSSDYAFGHNARNMANIGFDGVTLRLNAEF